MGQFDIIMNGEFTTIYYWANLRDGKRVLSDFAVVDDNDNDITAEQDADEIIRYIKAYDSDIVEE